MPKSPPQSDPVRIIIIMEDGHQAGRWSAGSPDLLDFVLIRDTRQQLEADLPAALNSYCERSVSYVFLRPKSLN